MSSRRRLRTTTSHWPDGHSGERRTPHGGQAPARPRPWTATVHRVSQTHCIFGSPAFGGTRVTLDTIVDAFETGATAEEIAQQYPTVPLVDVYSVITYFLRHKPEVDAYLKEREALAERVREEAERRFPAAGIRERLLARRK
jgi:uncharacterized protein (DUF433 family)